MIAWLESADAALFRAINLSLQNTILDKLMPFFSNPPGLAAALLIVFVLAFWKGGARARVCAAMLLLGLCAGDWVIADLIKHALARPRPFLRFADARLLVGMGGSYSMPSSHAMNWFGATMMLFVYYRRSIYVMLPLAVIVGFSRIYNGVHYPSDVLAGAILGAGCSAALLTTAQAMWQWMGPAWFPVWWGQFPSLLVPELRGRRVPAAATPATEGTGAQNDPTRATDEHWPRLGFVFIAVVLLVQLAYLAAGKIELTEDEAYQWLWSKHMAISYYSKPPLIACAQYLGTHLWGDNQFGVRFFSPLIAATISILVLRFLAREVNGRTAFVLLLILSVTPLMAVGATLMTVDPLSVLFWTAAMVAGWRAAQPDGTTGQWLWVGLWTGLGFLSKYTNLFQCVCWIVFFLLWPAARKHLRRPGPYAALLVVALCSLPVIIWNSQHHWITARHVWSDGEMSQKWRRSHTLEFLLTEAGFLHPLFFAGAIWAAVAFWRRDGRNPLELFLFSMGAPLFVMYLLLSVHSRVEPNWIAPSIIPLFCLMAVYWRRRWRRAGKALKPLLVAGIGIGVFGIVLLHDTNLTSKIIGRVLPPKFDPMRRVRGWKELAQIAGQARRKLEIEGKPAFIIGEHYGFTSEITFYLPEAKARVSADPLVFFYTTARPRNQYYFWPGYEHRAGQNAIFVREIDRPPMRPDWFSRWCRRDPDLYARDNPPANPVPPEVSHQFDSVTDLGVKDVIYPGHGVMRRVQLFQCRNLH